jgi:fluoride exporter
MPGNDEGHAPRLARLRPPARWMGAADRLPIDPDLAPDDAGEPSRAHRAGAPHPRRARPTVLAAIVAGGFLGTVARYGVERALPQLGVGFPTATFLVNCTGAFLLGLLLAALLERARPAPHLRPFAATGVLGGWTTYSTLAVDAATLGHKGDPTLAAGYLALTLVVGLTATAVGIALGRARLPALDGTAEEAEMETAAEGAATEGAGR